MRHYFSVDCLLVSLAFLGLLRVVFLRVVPLVRLLLFLVLLGRLVPLLVRLEVGFLFWVF